MRRILLGGLACAGILAAALAPRIEPEPEPTAFRPVSSSVLVCPELTGAGGATNVLAAMVAGPADGPGSAVLRPMTATGDLIRLDGPGEPVAVRSGQRSVPPILMQADGSWAPSALAGVLARQVEGASQGLSSAACSAPGPQWWFVGAGSQLGRGAALLVSNPAEEPARFDISLYSGAGPVQALAGKGIDLGPSSSVRLRLDALAPDEELLAIEVRATSGRVAAALRDVAVPSEDRPRGVDFIPAAQAPSNRVVVAGIPEGDGARDLVLVNPGAQFATVTPRLLTAAGPTAIEGLAAIAVPAGAVIQVDLTRVLAGRPGTLDMTSDVPVTGGARVVWGGARREIIWLSGVPLIDDPDPLGGAAVVPTGPGLTTTVTIAAPDGEVRGTLTVVTTPSQDVATLSGRQTGTDAAGTDKAGTDKAGTDAAGTDKAGTGDPDAAGPDAALPEVVLATQAARTEVIAVAVPAGSQRSIVVPGGGPESPAGLTTLSWRSDPGSGPVAVSHAALDATIPLATGYSWWPIASSVTAVGIREDLGILAPVD